MTPLETTARLKARIAGGLWLAVVVTGVFAEFVVRGRLIATGDAATTARNILAHEPLWRLGVMSDLMAGACYLGVVFCLYELLAPVNRSLSRVGMVLGLLGCAIASANLVNMLAPLALLGDRPYLAGLAPDQAQSLAYVFLKLRGYGASLALVFYSGFYLSLVGVLVYRSGFFPRILGALLAIAGGCYLVGCFANFLAPEFAGILFPWIFLPGLVAELAMAVWLSTVGLNTGRWAAENASARASA
jgi:hypothetical protein